MGLSKAQRDRLAQGWALHQQGKLLEAEKFYEAVRKQAPRDAEVLHLLGTVALRTDRAALAVELNDKAVKAAERRVHEVVRSAGEQREQAERELADASQTVDDLEMKLDEARTHGEAVEAKLTEVQTTSQAQAVELAQLRERLSAHEAERGRYQAEAERLRGDHEDVAKLRGQVEAMQTHTASLMEALSKRQL